MDSLLEYFKTPMSMYAEDPQVFSKAYEIMRMFMIRPDWPHCFDELDEHITHLLGVNLFGLVIVIYDTSIKGREFNWPDGVRRFMKDCLSFCAVVQPIVYQAWISRTRPMEFWGVARSEDNVGRNVLRFIRADGERLDCEVEEAHIRGIIKTLQEMLPPFTKDGSDGSSQEH